MVENRHPDLLDQHFLSTDAAESVAASADIRSEDVVLEIGAGTGALTAPLIARHPRRIYAVEVDCRLRAPLDVLSKRHPVLRLLWTDLRDLESVAIADVTVVVSNPPFSLLAPTIELLGRLPSLRQAVLVVGDRWSKAALASPESALYSRTSLAVQSRFSVHPVERILGDRFSPPIAGEAVLLRFEPAATTDPLLAELASAVEHRAGMRVKTLLRRPSLRADPAIAGRTARILSHPRVRAIQQRRLVALTCDQLGALVAAVAASVED